MPRPCITLLTDFGTLDGYVGALKGVLLSMCPAATAATIVDLTHDIPAGDVRAGAFALATAARTFPAGTIHVAVVDPGVGTDRRGLVVEAADMTFIGPDNGLLSLAAPPPRRIWILDRPQWFRHPVAPTFHGRDVFAPVAAHLASGTPPSELGTPVESMVELAVARPRKSVEGAIEGEVVHVDRFGNLITNVTEGALADVAGEPAGTTARENLAVTVAGTVVRLHETYGSAPARAPLALVGSAGLLEVAVNGGSARDVLGVAVGTPVRVHRERR